LKASPQHFQTLYLLGIISSQLGQPKEAERLIGEAVKVNPRAPDAFYNRGCLLQRLNRFDEAVDCFDKAITLKPDYFDALANRAVTLSILNRFDEALAAFDKALRIGPNVAPLWIEHGNTLRDAGRPLDSLKSYDNSLSLQKQSAEAWQNRGLALLMLNRPEEALLDFDRALKVAPDSIAALNGRGNALAELRHYADALVPFTYALNLDRENAVSLVGRGNVLLQLRRLDEAVADFDKVVKTRSDLVEPFINRGSALFQLKRVAEAARDYEKALSLDSSIPYACGNLVLYKVHGADWRTLDGDLREIAAKVRAGERVIPPFAHVALSSSPEELLLSARIGMSDKHPPKKPLWRGERYRHDRIRIAYLSADFHAHATAHLMAGVFENHDRKRFETAAISYGPDDKSEMRARLVPAFDRFVDVRNRSDAETAALLREMEIDIAIDLKGLTREARPGILSYRAVPVQMQYLGYPSTMGAPYVDYVLADRIVIPDEHRRFFSEAVAYLPDSYQCNDAKRPIAARTPSRSEAGLPQSGFVFCCFNNSYKILPPIFDVWMRLLKEIEGSVLWLLEDNATAVANFRREAEMRGVAASRVIFATRVGAADHLARHGLANLFLDTLPYGAHTTASDALWAGLPVLTCLGATFAGRVGASLLSAIGMPEMITRSLAEYEAAALKIARDPVELRALRTKLATKHSAALFDTRRFTRNLEAALLTMHERQQRGEKPASFDVNEPAA
ncbi:MAG TPA: tetratricopeptide repeat protein, partial [Micropepsaceae bacterium]|nr:tetratricopeptide repeat protein [Micropepsaceae bacterium]